MTNKDSVVFYQSQIEICKRHMTAEQFGRLMIALFEVDSGGDPEVDDDIVMAFEFMSLQSKISREKYDEICRKNRENGKKGGAPKGNRNAYKGEENNPKQPKQANGFQNNPKIKENKIRENKIKEDKIREESVPDQPSPSSILVYLNEKAKTKYQTDDPRACELITDLFDSGFTAEEICDVIDKKVVEWYPDYNMRGYLRPSTLFGSKFSEYLAAPVPGQVEAVMKKSDELKDAKKQLDAKRKQLNQVRTDLEDPDLIEESTHDINSQFYQLRDQEAILEADISRLQARVTALGG